MQPETTYHYGVLALSQDGDGAQSTTSVTTPAEPQSDPPAAPTGLTASNVQHDILTLTWHNPEHDSITEYRVLRGPDADNLSTLENDTESVSTEYEDDTVESETTYHYAVVALSQDGNSVQSGAISATTPAAPSSGEQDDPGRRPRRKTRRSAWVPGRPSPRRCSSATSQPTTLPKNSQPLQQRRLHAFQHRHPPSSFRRQRSTHGETIQRIPPPERWLTR